MIMRLNRRSLQIGLGLIWLLDAALQYQPYMFGKQFATQIIAPSGQGSPSWIASPISWTTTLILHHQILANAIFATVQLLLAVGLFWRRTATWTLLASLPWVALVWWLGEGAGGLFAGAQSPLMGSPGAVLLYGVAAILLLRGGDEDAHRSVANASPLRPLGAALVWLALWGGFIVETWQTANRTGNAAASMISGMADGEPGWLATINHSVGSDLTGHATLTAVALTAVFALAAAAIALPTPAARGALAVTIVLALAIWVIAQDLGGLLTGSATDPNTAPLLMLLALIYWPRSIPARPETPTVVAAATRELEPITA
jgi:hypothetical protein